MGKRRFGPKLTVRSPKCTHMEGSNMGLRQGAADRAVRVKELSGQRRGN